MAVFVILNASIFRSLYEDDCLLFATLLCLNIQAEGGENFTNEEMSLLLQGKILTHRALMVTEISQILAKHQLSDTSKAKMGIQHSLVF